MADLSPEKIVEPISEDQPCGPDLDMEFDMDFMNFMAEIEGKLPTRYFSFDSSTINFEDSYSQIDGFLDRTRDIRLLVPLAKLRILNGNIDGFVEALVAIEALLKAHWSDVHPQSPDFLDLRNAQLGTLDDMPVSVLPFQHATLHRSRRAGAITLRKWQLAQGDVTPREDEDVIDATTILSEIGDADRDEISALVERVTKARDALNSIRTISISEGDFDSAPSFDRLVESMDATIEMLKSGAGISDEAATDTDGEGDPEAGGAAVASGASSGVVVAMPTGDVATREDAQDALFAAEKYYVEKEPSSPVALLLREARSAANKTFVELVSEMVPAGARSAFFAFGKEPWFEVTLDNMNSRNPMPNYDFGDPPDNKSSSESAGLDDEERLEADIGKDDTAAQTEDGTTESQTSEADGSDAADPEEAGGDNENVEPDRAVAEGSAEATADDADDEDASAAPETQDDAQPQRRRRRSRIDWDARAKGESGNPPPSQPAPAPAAPAPTPAPERSAEGDAASPGATGSATKFVANNRAEALALIDKALNYYRLAEPSSPVALILEKAVEFSSKNFIGLLSEVLPAGQLKERQDPEEKPSRREGRRSS